MNMNHVPRRATPLSMPRPGDSHRAHLLGFESTVKVELGERTCTFVAAKSTTAERGHSHGPSQALLLTRAHGGGAWTPPGEADV